MAVLTYNSEEYMTFPPILREYASYLVAIKGNSEKTVCEYLLDLRTFFRYVKCRNAGAIPNKTDFTKISISDLTLDDIAKIKQQDIIEYLVFALTERTNNPTTRMRKASAIRSLYHVLCNKKHYLTENPALDIDSPKPAKTLPKYLSYEESLALLQTIKNDKASPTVVRDFAIVSLFLNTGMRLSELVGLDLNSFAPDLSTVKVRGKGNKERLLYLNDFARRAVADYLKVRLDSKYIRTSDKAFFLSSREQRISNKTVQWMVHKYFGLAGLGYKKYSVHKLRHTAATLMYRSGEVDIRILKEVLGHEQLNTTQIYTHVVNRNLKEAVDSNPLSDLKFKKQ